MAKIGNIIITTSKALDETKANAELLHKQEKELQNLKTYISTELDKFHKEMGDKPSDLNRNLGLYNPYNGLTSFAKEKKEDNYLVQKYANLDTLRFWSKEIPNAPQARKFIFDSIFARGFELKLNEGKTESLDLKNSILQFFSKCNNNRDNSSKSNQWLTKIIFT